MKDANRKAMFAKLGRNKGKFFDNYGRRGSPIKILEKVSDEVNIFLVEYPDKRRTYLSGANIGRKRTLPRYGIGGLKKG